MPVFIALLRGINVGKAKRLPMETLRELLADLGYTDVKTLLNSGNVFRAQQGTSEQHAVGIAAAIARTQPFEVPVIVKSAQQLAQVVADNPLVAADPSRLLVAFAPDAEMLATLAPIQPLVVPPEAFALGPHGAYLHCPGGILDSKAGTAMLGKAGKAVTTRNWATVLKLQALAAEMPP